MTLHLKSVDLKTEKIKTLIIPICEDKEIHDNEVIVSLVKQAKKLKEFTGKKDDELVLYHLPKTKIDRAVFYGMGKAEKMDAETIRSVAGKGIKKCIKDETDDIYIAAPAASPIPLDDAILFESLMEGACLANHVFDKYKKEKTQKILKNIYVITEKSAAQKFRKLPLRVLNICQGTLHAREWVSTPPNDKKPDQFARIISSLSRKQGLAVRIFGEKELKQKKFGSLLAVSAGSRSKPRMVVLEHRPKTPKKKTIVLVGKGVTFDSGGINLKPSGGLEDMKTDMSGAAAVAATLISAARLNMKQHIIGVMPMVENMPSGDASRPGDIVKSYSGKTVEIGNTDAEGRLILIDAMSWAVKQYKPHTIIDMATLTGACMVALGEKIAGLFSFDDSLALDILDSADKTYERCWRLPLPDDYKELLKSDLADIKNISSTRYGGAITGALFISEFMNGQRWAHIDIAGPASSNKAHAYCNVGGTGFGVRLMIDFLEKQ